MRGIMRKWTKIFPFFLVEWYITKINPHLEYVTIGRIPKRMSYVYAVYDDMVLVKDTEAIKKSRLRDLEKEVQKIKNELNLS